MVSLLRERGFYFIGANKIEAAFCLVPDKHLSIISRPPVLILRRMAKPEVKSNQMRYRTDLRSDGRDDCDQDNIPCENV